MKRLLGKLKPALPLFAVASLAMANEATAAECGDVSIAEMNWASAGVAANIDKVILEKGYGCKVTLVTGDTLPTFASMTEKNQPDVAPEMWVNLLKEPLEKAIQDGKVVNAARLLKDGGAEGWWVPDYILEANPDIKTVADALKHPELFPAPEDPSKGAVYDPPAGWTSQISTANLFKAFDAKKKGFVLVDTGSAAGLDGTIASAYEKKKGWLGFYWAPTALLGKYKMSRLPFGVEHDAAEWARCTVVAECADPKINSYPKPDVFTVVTRKFATDNAVTMDYFNKRGWPNDVVNNVLAWMSDNQGTNIDAAKYFLKKYPEVWASWVTPEAAEKVKGSL
ncbi:glycine betaine ABC transporter substrate-binding protein [Rhizobium sp. 2YAF20]|uniref:glycine betaine ABC transporter substrate-binding protein n=1 Tax=Rhizobium sp. 2YAF20 TaxID=3233027 RepID=UPI003F9DC176